MMDIEERDYRQLRKLGQKLHIPIPEAFLELEVRDQDGRVIQRHKQRSHSWVRNAYNAMFINLAGKDPDDVTFGAGLLSMKDTGGVIVSVSAPLFYASSTSLDGTGQGYRAPAGDDDRGIVVGSGVAAESFEDYALETKIANGTAAGQLSYVESAAHSITWIGGSLTLKNALIRYFNNNSGASVEVNEVGLIVFSYYSVQEYLVSRDKLASPVTIPNTGQLKVTYTVQLTYPA
ncbi:hypothetical protein ES705_16952 [subsurface metagenome]